MKTKHGNLNILNKKIGIIFREDRNDKISLKITTLENEVTKFIGIKNKYGDM